MTRAIQTFQVAIKALLVHDDRLLLVQESDEPNWWELPGGRIDQGEEAAAPADVLRRELREELGPRFSCEIGEPLVCWVRPPVARRPMPVFLVGLACIAPRGEIELSPEHRDLHWVARDEWQRMELAPGYEVALRRVFDVPRR
jgi:8-oxo-dGTP pyrophosphatase MutT (NUDIX family)